MEFIGTNKKRRFPSKIFVLIIVKYNIKYFLFPSHLFRHELVTVIEKIYKVQDKRKKILRKIDKYLMLNEYST